MRTFNIFDLRAFTALLSICAVGRAFTSGFSKTWPRADLDEKHISTKSRM